MPKRELIIGKSLANGYLLAAYSPEARLVLARSPHPDTPEPWVVWHLDQDNDTWGGRYYKERWTAESYYHAKCSELLS